MSELCEQNTNYDNNKNSEVNFKNEDELSAIQMSTYKPKCLKFDFDKSTQDLEPGLIYSRSPDKAYNSMHNKHGLIDSVESNHHNEYQCLLIMKDKELTETKYKCAKLEAENERYKKKCVQLENITQKLQQEKIFNDSMSSKIQRMENTIQTLEQENASLQMAKNNLFIDIDKLKYDQDDQDKIHKSTIRELKQAQQTLSEKYSQNEAEWIVQSQQYQYQIQSMQSTHDDNISSISAAIQDVISVLTKLKQFIILIFKQQESSEDGPPYVCGSTEPLSQLKSLKLYIKEIHSQIHEFYTDKYASYCNTQ